MSLFGNAPRRRRTKRQILAALERKIAKKERARKKKQEKMQIDKKIEQARAKLRRY